MLLDASLGSSLVFAIITLAVMLIVNMLLVMGSSSASDYTDGGATLPQPDSTEASPSQYDDNRSTALSVDADGSMVANIDEEVNVETVNIDNNWRCACEGGFLPPGLLRSFAGAEAAMRMGTGQCYHQKAA